MPSSLLSGMLMDQSESQPIPDHFWKPRSKIHWSEFLIFCSWQNLQIWLKSENLFFLASIRHHYELFMKFHDRLNELSSISLFQFELVAEFDVDLMR